MLDVVVLQMVHHVSAVALKIHNILQLLKGRLLWLAVKIWHKQVFHPVLLV